MNMRLCIAFIAIFIAPISSAQEYAALPGVAVSSTAVYARLPQGGVQAIDLKTGNVLWRTSQARWPLAVGQGKVAVLGPLSQGNNGSVLFLDETTGKTQSKFGPVQFASWAQIKFDYQNRDSTFRMWVARQNANGAIFFWQAERYPQTTLQNWNRPQSKMIQSGRVTVNFTENAVQSVFGPIGENPPRMPPPDRSLPLLRGQKAVGSIVLDADTTLALISANGNVDLACFRDRQLQWSVRVTGQLN